MGLQNSNGSMTHYNTKKILCLFLIILLVPIFAHASDEKEAWRNEFTKRLNQLATREIGIDVEKLNEEILKQQALIIASDTAIPAIFELWLRDDSNIEFFWWRQECRVTRSFIMALFPEAVTISESRVLPISAGPNFNYHVTRFQNK